MKNPLEAIEIVNLDHLGIVAGVIDEMELVEEVNKKVGLRAKEAVSPGQVMKAMILNGLGFLSAPLYLFENFFVGKATEHLIGEGVIAEQLNDDRIGRALDKYYEVGTTNLFTAIALKAAQKFQVEKESVHLDSSSISVEGEYKSKEEENQEIEEEMKAIKIVHGYSRDKRPDLKQFIIDMVVSGDGDVPLYLKIDDGNADDKSVFVERLKEFKKQWTFEGICVADSALYTAENIGAMAGMKWITRVPLSIKEAQNKIVEIEEEEWEQSQIKGYRIATKSSEYANIKQRWLVVESEARKKAALKKISEQVEKQLENAKASLRKLLKQEYACIADAEIGIKMLSDSWKYHEIKEIKCTEKASKKSQSKTEKGNQEKTIVYQVTGEIEPRESVIEAEKIKAGRFILATNILDKKEVSNEKLLAEYKAQQSNERGFRFLKDPLFFTASVFVKKPERVEAIAMIMGLCLLVYNLAQRKLRKQLETAQEGVRNQVKKITNKPTMRWIFQMFQAVHLVRINGEKQVSNLTQERQEILQHLGKDCCQYYLMIPGG
ncbi:IS1634 family transposase [Planktothrix agardhii]|jgi:transposase|uniref:Transposase n=2 Tax=Planktothrix agardhii TaxID=1160 RepID=A0AAD1V4B6_PLAAG|nr:IS1634 family transposase [Planktothrix agardhii]AQY60683.1 transposase [Planktothrix agardhii No66]MCB8788951.1 IS1634 family transposase [Planktothrix agardhii 1025]MDS1344457.1 IS1634 family transposase [Planktothrix agardhii NRERC-751]MDS1344786.1 IS1634 family transposase [Planktothrix agardhii NRERC-751]MDS1345045.1 IS1634 family transposase [Planktothrix agardhii NRERC-751]